MANERLDDKGAGKAPADTPTTSKSTAPPEPAQPSPHPLVPQAPAPVQQVQTQDPQAPPPNINQLIPAPTAPVTRPSKDTTTCTAAPGRFYVPGEVVVRWGYSWTAGADGRTLTSEIPNEDVDNGVAAGRWKADGMTLDKSAELFLRQQYRDHFGLPAQSDMSVEQMRHLINLDLQRQGGAGRRSDFILA